MQMKQTKTKLINNAIALQQKFAAQINLNKSVYVAQKMGFEKKPDKKLDAEEWRHIETKAKQRIEENRHNELCSICLEPFKMEDQILLNCSHLFHKICLQNFEQFMKLANSNTIRKCPVCRKDAYQKKVSSIGKEDYKIQCAILIQSIWRGYRCRKKYFLMKLNKNPEAKRKYYAEKLKQLSCKLERTLKVENSILDRALESIDKSIERNHLAFLSNEEWDKIVQPSKARKLLSKDAKCTICLQELTDRSVLLTSCGHSFHCNCLQSFERYSQYHDYQCPCCRTLYVSREITL